MIQTKGGSVRVLGVAAGVFFALWASHAQGAAQRDASAGKGTTDSAIEETKAKGFDGVDFSYDVFGAPPGQDPQKIAEEVMAKDIEEKPKVMAKQKQLLRDRYNLDCKTQSGVTMTKGKSQPIGPT